MTVMDYLSFCAGLQGYPKEKIPGRVKEMVVACGLDPEKHKKIGELSKGYRQRVGLAQAMIHDPEVLILDEPTTGLDPNQIVEIRKLIRELGKEKTVILSTHILPEVEATCDRILIINKGKIVADGTAESLRKQSRGQNVIRIRGEEVSPGEALAAILLLPSVAEAALSGNEDPGMARIEITSKPGMESAKEIFRLFSSRNWILTEMIPQESRLEDIFRDLTIRQETASANKEVTV
jgi:ABC-2 type transport system ATP-binding protein